MIELGFLLAWLVGGLLGFIILPSKRITKDKWVLGTCICFGFISPFIALIF